MKTRKQNKRKSAGQEGSALLVSLMVMVGLSLLGLGFVAISETESAIAVNERNYLQAQAAAEAGAKIAIEWFQDAEWAYLHKILPPNVNALKTQRRLHDDDGNVTLSYYKAPGELLFDVPFKITASNRFYGNENTPDVVITLNANATATTFLNTLNAELFADNTVRISDIRVYAPPMPGATLVETTTMEDSGFWQEGSGGRYGVATVRVTAQKLAGNRVVATRNVKMVLTETPFPTVDGAIETSGSLVGQGNFHVYWGKILSEQETQVNRPAVGMPWFDAKTQMTFEYGYDSTVEWKASTAYVAGDVIHAPNSDIAIDGELEKFSYICTGPGTSAGAPHATAFWPKAVGTSAVEPQAGGPTWKAQPSRPYPLDPTEFYEKFHWLYALLDQTIQDPWLHARARGALTYDNNGKVPCGAATEPHPCDFASEAESVTGRYSNFFQHQTFTDSTTDEPERIEVFFPTMDYEFWKAVAQSGDNQPGSDLYYFRPVGTGASFVGPGGVTKPVEDWLNARQNGLGAGFYFFDTQSPYKNPQYGKGGKLTEAVKVNAQDGKDWQMQGYVYLNAEFFGTSGQGNMIEDDVYSMPGEPYRDIGYREVDTTTNKYALEPSGGVLPAASFRTAGRSNKQWDFQDINENGVFDWYVAKNTKALAVPNGGTIDADDAWLIVPWFENCTVPTLDKMDAQVWPAPNVACSEPHEPYVNILYPAQNSPKAGVKIGWHDRLDETKRRPKLKTGTNTAVACADDTPLRDCTSNGYDEDGALVTLSPLLWGALYNEGGYNGTGNAVYYGAVLMRGNFNASGTPEVFFNECLARGCLESQLDMQRVMVTSFETDQ
ncbi:MAG TPA: hypothetical protein VEK57_17185 [Thermoanaerobaculia bacterium]|nr:hypothetical protein [Thermoanaerobaculia bacterium]